MSETNPVSSSCDAILASAARVTEPVHLSRSVVEIRGVTVMEFVSIVRKFPRVRELLVNAIGALDDEGADEAKLFADLMAQFIDAGPEALATVIAAAAGEKDNADYVRAVLKLGDDDFFALLDRVLELTMPRGIGDFFGRFRAVAARVGLFAPVATLSVPVAA